MAARRSVALLVALVPLLCLSLVLGGCRGRRDLDGRDGDGPPLPARDERRASFDFGSGTMKLRVFDVRLRGERPVGARPVSGGDYTFRVDFQADLNDSEDGRFGAAVRRKGLEAAGRLAAHARRLGARRLAGVCTGAFRLARDGRAYVEELSRATGIRLVLPTAAEEARLGFLAAQAVTGIPSDRLVVWDIGASTLSLSAVGADGRVITHESPLASVTLRDRIIRRIKGEGAEVKSPNPMSPSDVALAVRLAEEAARRPMPAAIPLRLNRASTVVVGIGPVHYFSVREQLPPDRSYDQNGVSRALKDQTGKTDAEIGGAFPDTQVVNLALVLGTMRALNVRAVRPLDVNIAHGLLFATELWTPAPAEGAARR